MILSKEKFFHIQKNVDRIPFNQTEEWLESTKEKKDTIVYFADDEGEAEICCWGKSFNRKFIGRHLVLDGVSFSNNITSKSITKYFSDIISEGFNLVEVSDINMYNVNIEIGFRRAGFKRPLGLAYCPLTLIVDLQDEFKFHRNWKRNVKKCKKLLFKFEHIKHPKITDIETFVDIYQDLKERKSIVHNLSAEGIMKLFYKNRFELFYVKDVNDRYVSGRIEYIDKQTSYDVLAANTFEANNSGASYYLQESILYYLKNRGIKYFDFGRISPSLNHMDNIYVSKNYSGGKPAVYNGQWQYARKPMIDYTYNIFRNIRIKSNYY